MTLAVLKADGISPELREKLMRMVRNGLMLLEIAWRRVEGIGSGGQVVA